MAAMAQRGPPVGLREHGHPPGDCPRPHRKGIRRPGVARGAGGPGTPDPPPNCAQKNRPLRGRAPHPAVTSVIPPDSRGSPVPAYAATIRRLTTDLLTDATAVTAQRRRTIS